MVRFGAEMVFSSKDSTITDENIDRIVAKGEAATAELDAKMKKFTEDAIKFKMDDTAELYGFDDDKDENKFDIKKIASENWIEPPKREQKRKVCLAFANEVLCWLYGTVKENEDYILQFAPPFNRLELLQAQSCPDAITNHVEQSSVLIRKIPRDLTEASVSGAWLSIATALAMIFLFGMEDGLLHTACGTPNYVAPEVLKDKGYDGTSSDIWSCGVILFVLMAGYLPFDEPSLIGLYKKIWEASFSCPSWFSSSARNLIKRILDSNPLTRITIPEILQDEWFKKWYKPPKFEQDEDVNLDDNILYFTWL
ncbi:hypothetical protein ES288_A11G165800v1 [Gossypium darwinii]|nr:hypothetical protein ES288_A11G165800v1 [Gossypium darwinii]